MRADTSDRRSFELVTMAMEKLEDYSREHEVPYLEEAESALEEARNRDPEYLSAHFYSGVVKDLIGKPVDAVPFFDRVLKGLPQSSEHRRDEIQYSRGVAWYHQYSHKKLARAEVDFLAVVDRSTDVGLVLLARAGLAQTYAMWMIPPSNEKKLLLKGEAAGTLDFIAQKRDRCLQEINFVSKQLDSTKKPLSRRLMEAIRGTILNAHGMSEMYWSDYNVPSAPERQKLLANALALLKNADEHLPGDWANTCDIASAHFRLGAVTKLLNLDPGPEFEAAIELLEKVINELRPNYGFAFYEIGRIYRVWGRFQDASGAFQKALAISVEYRDVGDSTVKQEVDRVQSEDSTFP